MSQITRPLISYYGSKWRAALRYAPPAHPVIVEPFAGSAGYALHWPERQVLLVDRDSVLCGVWDYLIRASAEELLRLPILEPGQRVEDHTWPCDEARHLVGYWLAPGQTYPVKRMSSWASQWPSSSSWCEPTRAALAQNVAHIRHWRIQCGDYTQAHVGEATYFVDPPYGGSHGRSYRCDNRAINYEQLAHWCEQLPGQVIVCEQQGADWLPFEPLYEQHGARRRSVEAVCYLGQQPGQLSLLTP